MSDGPALIDSVLGFVVLIVPGFLCVRGFFRGRARVIPDQPLYLLAQAVVSSLLLIAAAWWLGARHLAHWAQAGTLIAGPHERYTYEVMVILLLAAFPVGLISGGIVEWGIERLMKVRQRLGGCRHAYERAIAQAGRTESEGQRFASLAEAAKLKPGRGSGLAWWLLGALEQRELLDTANAWSKTWRHISRKVKQRGDDAYVYVRVRTRDGGEITGAFGDGSWAAFAPHPQDLYIESVYRPLDPNAPDGPYAPVEDGLGVFVSGTEIASVEFRGPQATQRRGSAG
jgi:hypothetical protein